MASPKGVYHIENGVKKPAYTCRECYSSDEKRDWVFGEIHSGFIQENEDLIKYIKLLKTNYLKFPLELIFWILLIFDKDFQLVNLELQS